MPAPIAAAPERSTKQAPGKKSSVRPKSAPPKAGKGLVKDGKGGELSTIALRVLMKIMWATRSARGDSQRAVGALSSMVSRWTVLEDKKLHRLVCYLNSFADYMRIGFIGDTAKGLRLMLFTDADFAGCQDTKKSTNGGFLCITGPNSFFPLSQISKKQTAVSLSTTEAEIVSMVYGLKMLGLPSLDLWETVLDKPMFIDLLQDNQATMRVAITGKHGSLRHTGRTHGVSVAWLHHEVKSQDINLCDCDTTCMAADIFTKHFVGKVQWQRAIHLIGIVGPDFRKNLKMVDTVEEKVTPKTSVTSSVASSPTRETPRPKAKALPKKKKSRSRKKKNIIASLISLRPLACVIALHLLSSPFFPSSLVASSSGCSFVSCASASSLLLLLTSPSASPSASPSPSLSAAILSQSSCEVKVQVHFDVFPNRCLSTEREREVLGHRLLQHRTASETSVFNLEFSLDCAMAKGSGGRSWKAFGGSDWRSSGSSHGKASPSQPLLPTAPCAYQDVRYKSMPAVASLAGTQTTTPVVGTKAVPKAPAGVPPAFRKAAGYALAGTIAQVLAVSQKRQAHIFDPATFDNITDAGGASEISKCTMLHPLLPPTADHISLVSWTWTDDSLTKLRNDSCKYKEIYEKGERELNPDLSDLSTCLPAKLFEKAEKTMNFNTNYRYGHGLNCIDPNKATWNTVAKLDELGNTNLTVGFHSDSFCAFYRENGKHNNNVFKMLARNTNFTLIGGCYPGTGLPALIQTMRAMITSGKKPHCSCGYWCANDLFAANGTKFVGNSPEVISQIYEVMSLSKWFDRVYISLPGTGKRWGAPIEYDILLDRFRRMFTRIGIHTDDGMELINALVSAEKRDWKGELQVDQWHCADITENHDLLVDDVLQQIRIMLTANPLPHLQAYFPAGTFGLRDRHIDVPDGRDQMYAVNCLFEELNRKAAIVRNANASYDYLANERDAQRRKADMERHERMLAYAECVNIERQIADKRAVTLAVTDTEYPKLAGKGTVALQPQKQQQKVWPAYGAPPQGVPPPPPDFSPAVERDLGAHRAHLSVGSVYTGDSHGAASSSSGIQITMTAGDAGNASPSPLDFGTTIEEQRKIYDQICAEKEAKFVPSTLQASLMLADVADRSIQEVFEKDKHIETVIDEKTFSLEDVPTPVGADAAGEVLRERALSSIAVADSDSPPDAVEKTDGPKSLGPDFPTFVKTVLKTAGQVNKDPYQSGEIVQPPPGHWLSDHVKETLYWDICKYQKHETRVRAWEKALNSSIAQVDYWYKAFLLSLSLQFRKTGMRSFQDELMPGWSQKDMRMLFSVLMSSSSSIDRSLHEWVTRVQKDRKHGDNVQKSETRSVVVCSEFYTDVDDDGKRTLQCTSSYLTRPDGTAVTQSGVEAICEEAVVDDIKAEARRVLMLDGKKDEVAKVLGAKPQTIISLSERHLQKELKLPSYGLTYKEQEAGEAELPHGEDTSSFLASVESKAFSSRSAGSSVQEGVAVRETQAISLVPKDLVSWEDWLGTSDIVETCQMLRTTQKIERIQELADTAGAVKKTIATVLDKNISEADIIPAVPASLPDVNLQDKLNVIAHNTVVEVDESKQVEEEQYDDMFAIDFSQDGIYTLANIRYYNPEFLLEMAAEPVADPSNAASDFGSRGSLESPRDEGSRERGLCLEGEISPVGASRESSARWSVAESMGTDGSFKVVKEESSDGFVRVGAAANSEASVVSHSTFSSEVVRMQGKPIVKTDVVKEEIDSVTSEGRYMKRKARAEDFSVSADGSVVRNDIGVLEDFSDFASCLSISDVDFFDADVPLEQPQKDSGNAFFAESKGGRAERNRKRKDKKKKKRRAEKGTPVPEPPTPVGDVFISALLALSLLATFVARHKIN